MPEANGASTPAFLPVSIVSVRSRDVSPSWAGCVAGLTKEEALLVRPRRSTIQCAGRCDRSTQHRKPNCIRWGGPKRARGCSP